MSGLSYKREVVKIDKHIDIQNEDLLRQIIYIYNILKTRILLMIRNKACFFVFNIPSKFNYNE